MTTYELAIKPMGPLYGHHDQSAVLFEDGDVVFGVEEERFTREKHALETFPKESVKACLEHAQIEMGDLDRVLVPFEPSLMYERIWPLSKRYLFYAPELDKLHRIWNVKNILKSQVRAQLIPTRRIEGRLSEIGTPVPPIETKRHHACHAASAFYPTDFDEALVLTIDGRGENDATVVWRADQSGLERLRTYDYPNSLGLLYGIVTAYLGFYIQNGEGKVMGLAPYGRPNDDIESSLRSQIETGLEYDVTEITDGLVYRGTKRLEELFGRPRRLASHEQQFVLEESDRTLYDQDGPSVDAQIEDKGPSEFDQWEKDLAFVTQQLLEETVVDIIEHYADRLGISNVCLAGGVALNCKMNKRVMESEYVDDVFVQPVANDAGVPIGAGYLDQDPSDVSPQTTVYWGPDYQSDEIEECLEERKISYEQPDDLERAVAERIADGDLVGWFQGRMEMGPRALGNRSILADPRTAESRDRVNEYVKHREGWRPFAPSMLEEAVDEYLVDGKPAPFMIKTFDVDPERKDEIEAVVHPADDTTRPQTVNEDQNPRYYRLLSEFEDITGVPVLLNTSFNDHAEPIVNTPTEAIKDFYGMGLDVLVLNDYLVEKQ
ncbi:carbamoyltransferase [Halomicrobium salinisoli]|uniref:carbamoyltransferase family protein n=1 Tax=Halomicrobium salinisoli TaxID=2878391 RepID=UPI001CEFE77A|nr:carbamoyltransferase C-terminal domain-containing protein [Halomicrobium salinisoli]